ncbi:unnamed protein product [Mytilus coruscus]|uniref:Uncharacterized protein n=1 Tax=Mytilus coruscus TaxID=42192 RepID=A0A6J8EMT4_MYTCO|nr:unnamed protein product [Mytilus coruscus]
MQKDIHDIVKCKAEEEGLHLMMELDQHNYDVYKVIIFWKLSDYQESLLDDCEEYRDDLERQEAVRRDWHPRGCARAREDEQPIGQTQDTTKETKRTTSTDNGCTCFCGKVCKNASGLKIHQSRMKCVPPHSGNQRIERSGQTEEETIQEANHSDDNLHVNQGGDEHIDQLTEIEQLTEGEEINLIEPTVRREMLEPRKEKIKWPTSADKGLWKAFDEDIENFLEATLAGNIDRKMRAMTSIIYSLGKDRFGLITYGKRERTQGQSNRRQ